jgi:transcriptional antiterminator NusG
VTETNDEFPIEDSNIEIDLGADEPEVSLEIGIDLDFATDDEPADEVDIDLDAGTAASDEAVIEALRSELRGQIGDWYVVHTYSGMENRVKQNLDSRVRALGMEDYIFETVVPTEEVTEIRNGAKRTLTRTVLPGYVLVRMEMTDESWAAVRHTPSVTGFVAHASSPVPLDTEEVVKMLTPAALAKAASESAGRQSGRNKRKVEVADFSVGDSVMVVDGPFTGVHATITEINANNQRLKALVEFMGRETPVDLEFRQVQKV